MITQTLKILHLSCKILKVRLTILGNYALFKTKLNVKVSTPQVNVLQ